MILKFTSLQWTGSTSSQWLVYRPPFSAACLQTTGGPWITGWAAHLSSRAVWTL